MTAYGIELKVFGDYGCFTRPELKVERVSYDVITPSAARGILERIHWKPAIRWVIDEIHVLSPIVFQNIRRNEVNSKIPATTARSAMANGDLSKLAYAAATDRTQRASQVLVRPSYVIRAHLVMTEKAGELDNPMKHKEMFVRRVAKGQVHDQPSMGVREFAAHFEAVDDTNRPTPVRETRDLGIMLLDMDYGRGKPSPVFFRAVMNDGVIKVPDPNSPEALR